jgi:hypothetical protein
MSKLNSKDPRAVPASRSRSRCATSSYDGGVCVHVWGLRTTENHQLRDKQLMRCNIETRSINNPHIIITKTNKKTKSKTAKHEAKTV